MWWKGEELLLAHVGGGGSAWVRGGCSTRQDICDVGCEQGLVVMLLKLLCFTALWQIMAV